MTTTDKPKRSRRSQLEMTVEHVAKLPLDQLATLAATLRDTYPRAAAFLHDELECGGILPGERQEPMS